MARAAFLNNAKGIAKAAEACDLSRATQQVRFDTLRDLEEQQKTKAANLKASLDEDAEAKQLQRNRNRDVHSASRADVSRSAESVRLRMDINAGVPKAVAKNKERERQGCEK